MKPQVRISDDFYHTSKVRIRCIPGCKVDTHCPRFERCFKGQCVPKTCPEVGKRRRAIYKLRTKTGASRTPA